jgi:hypothetical protein
MKLSALALSSRPGVENCGQIDEAGGDRDIGDVRYPELVGTVDEQIAGAIRKDRAIVIAVGRSHITASAAKARRTISQEIESMLLDSFEYDKLIREWFSSNDNFSLFRVITEQIGVIES